MNVRPFVPTLEQKSVIGHCGNAFISACPGAGKTQVLVERARKELKNTASGQGLAFLSFTNAAISELKRRLQLEALLLSPPFPHYVGTFDTFIWQFFIAPLGVPGQTIAPQLIPDMDARCVKAYPGAQGIPLSCFDRTTGAIITDKAKQEGFDPANKTARLIRQYEEVARQCRARFMARGELGFSDVRTVVKGHLTNVPLSARLSAALAARFREIIVDEAQDCNPADIEIINWLRRAGIVTKVICDPHQSIYEFRGGVTDQLFALRDSFGASERLTMSGNFRSNANICKAIAAFRAPANQQAIDQPLGRAANDPTHIHVLLYSGTSVPLTIGRKFEELLRTASLSPVDCPVVSSTKDSACKAIGQTVDPSSQDRTLRLALAVASFHIGQEVNARKMAMEAMHKIILELEGHLGEKTYSQHVTAEGLKPEDWRPCVLQFLQCLRFDPATDSSADTWLTRAKTLLTPHLAAGGSSIAQMLRRHQDLAAVFTATPVASLTAKTIHSVKGMQFPGICVILTTKTAKSIIDYLTTGQPQEMAESARKLYVAASRAERLLVIAVPRSQGSRLAAHISNTSAQVTQITLT
jgi:DNA helicase-2/ATP-dependent DNA helicase PcrA